MTIAAGLLLSTTNEIILAADTQETLPDAKVEGQKMMVLEDQRDPAGCVLFTGAGDAGYLDALGQKILRVFHDHPELRTPNELKQAFEDVLVRFYKKHVLPFGEAWAGGQLAVSTLIAYQRDGRRALFKSGMAALTEYPLAAVGTGHLYALSLLRSLADHPMLTETALRLVALAIYRAKERDPYCGKKTHLVLLGNCRHQLVDQAVIENWEDIFAELEQYDRALYGLSLGVLQSASDQQLKDFVRTLDTMSGRFAPSGVTH